MGGRLGESLTGRRRWPVAISLAVYTLLVSLSPALHHDLACHVKSPAHCDACAANPLASRAEPGAGLDAPPLLAGGETPASVGPHEHPAPVASTSGRSPPA